MDATQAEMRKTETSCQQRNSASGAVQIPPPPADCGMMNGERMAQANKMDSIKLMVRKERESPSPLNNEVIL